MVERLLKLRKTLRLTQEKFGEKIGLTRDAVAAYERGIANPTGSALKCIELAYNVNPHWLETGEGPMFQETAKSYVESLVKEHDMGPGGRALMRSLLRFYEELGEEATLKVIQEILPIGQEALAQAEHDKILARWFGEDDKTQAE